MLSFGSIVGIVSGLILAGVFVYLAVKQINEHGMDMTFWGFIIAVVLVILIILIPLLSSFIGGKRIKSASSVKKD